MRLLALLLSLSLLVFTHELGHLGFAKLFGTRVRRFYLFFNWGFSILKAKKFDGRWHFLFFNRTTPKEWEEKEPDRTLWGIGWVPLGGYCDIAGMIDETKGADDLASEPQPWEYRSKPAWQRLCIISGGVLVNFISALFIYSCIFAHWGQDELPMRNAMLGYDYHQVLIDEGLQNGDIIWQIDGEDMTDIAATQERILLSHPKTITVARMNADSIGGRSLVDINITTDIAQRLLREEAKLIMAIRMPFVIDDFAPGSVALKAGLLAGDSVVGIDGNRTLSYSEVKEALSLCGGRETEVAFYRRDSLGAMQLMRQSVELPSDGLLGVYVKSPTQVFPIEHTDYTFLQAIPVGISYGWETLATYVSQMKLIFTKEGVRSLGGFGTMAGMFPDRWDWLRFWNMTALMGIILAFMNIIPIPGLDGGHIVYTLWEIITRRKPSEKFLEVSQTIGMILLFALLILANGNDIIRLLR